MSKDPKSPGSYAAGIVVSFLLAAWLALLGMIAVTQNDLGYGAIGLILGVLYVGVPLALILLALWIAYLIRTGGRVPARIHALMFLPTLLAIPIVPIGYDLKAARQERSDEAHPGVHETHVNMSGQTLGLIGEPDYGSGGGMPLLPADSPDRFTKLIRYPDRTDAGRDFPYDGTRLKEDVTQFNYKDVPYFSPPLPAHAPLPLRRSPYPDMARFLAGTGERESEILVHLYYHYPDHVDVAPAIARFAASQEAAFWRKNMGGLILISVYNYLPASIARLEVNGQALDPGEYAVRAIPPSPAPCRETPTPMGGAFVDLGQTLTLRWQTIASPGRWQSAALAVPDFRHPLPREEQEAPIRLLLYIFPDGTAKAERYLEIADPHDDWAIRAIRATGLPESAQRYAACGSIYDRFDPDAVRLLPD
ncbi:hypothetical protein [Arboricoccus pini]|nr:hypothetical protein [Arboricoccus pini]